MKKVTKDGFCHSFSFVLTIGSIAAILGLSMKELVPLEKCNEFVAFAIRFSILFVVFLLIGLGIRMVLLCKTQKGYRLIVGGNNVSIKRADIFQENAWRVIPVDTRFQTKVDDVIISKNSLHGQLVLQHGNADDINQIVEQEAKRLGIKKQNGCYSFELGTAIPYSAKDGDYIMVALTELNSDNKAQTNIGQFENTLIRIWEGVDRIYAKRPVSLPVLGSGITRFVDDPLDTEETLMCMLRMLKRSKVHLKTNITILLHSEEDEKILLSLYERHNELKDLR